MGSQSISYLPFFLVDNIGFFLLGSSPDGLPIRTQIGLFGGRKCPQPPIRGRYTNIYFNSLKKINMVYGIQFFWLLTFIILTSKFCCLYCFINLCLFSLIRLWKPCSTTSRSRTNFPRKIKGGKNFKEE